MKHRSLICCKNVECENLYDCDGHPFDLEYYMVQTRDKEQNCFVYGVEIRKIVTGLVEETASEYQIGRTFDRAKKLIDVLASNTVTPSGFVDIIEDIEF